jgi:hypothetical protein
MWEQVELWERGKSILEHDCQSFFLWNMTAKVMKVTSIFVSGPTYGLRQCVGYLLQVDPFLHLQANFWWAWV